MKKFWVAFASSTAILGSSPTLAWSAEIPPAQAAAPETVIQLSILDLIPKRVPKASKPQVAEHRATAKPAPSPAPAESFVATEGVGEPVAIAPDYGARVAALIESNRSHLAQCLDRLPDSKVVAAGDTPAIREFKVRLTVRSTGRAEVDPLDGATQTKSGAQSEGASDLETAPVRACLKSVLASIPYPRHELDHPVEFVLPIELQKEAL